jgi:hypothetical protein
MTFDIFLRENFFLNCQAFFSVTEEQELEPHHNFVPNAVPTCKNDAAPVLALAPILGLM